MRILNLDLLKNIILPGLLGSSIWSALIAIAVGVVVGLIVGLIQRRLRQTPVQQAIFPAIVGCFVGTMLICMLPILAIPGIVGGGPYGGIWIMVIATFTLPIGAIGGAILGGTTGKQLFKKQNRRFALLVLAGTYSFMAIVIYGSASVHCSQRNTLPDYCTDAGYPPAYRQRLIKP